MVKAKRDVVNAAILLAFAAGYLWFTLDIPGGDRRYGPAFMPLVVAVALLALALVLLVTSAVRAARNPDEKLVLDARELFRQNDKIVYIFLAMVVYALAVSQLGYLISTPVFMLAVYYIVVRSWNRRSWVVVAGYVAFVVAIAVIFEQGLQIPLPQGALL